MQTEPFVDGLAYPECPRWHRGAVWLSDQHAGVVVKVDVPGAGRPAPVAEEVAAPPTEPAGLGWAPDGTLLVVSMHDRRLLAFDPDGAGAPGTGGGRFRTVADLAPFHPGLSNELLVDPAGRAYVGNIGFDYYGGQDPRPTVVVLVHPDGAVRVAADDLLVPNGMVLTPDGATLVVAESFAHRLTAFTVAADGSLGHRRVFADLDDDIPDGICLDADGAVWYAAIGRHQVVRVLPGGGPAGKGTVDERVSTGDREAVACMLGGPDRRRLFVCTTLHLDPEHSVPARSGRLEVVDVAVPGAGLP
ncbi:MAG TPA: SMP-30/gluconolactonase/LRE family protein [Acidimicrobiales bacterium]|nr:SMP-30/gluconolactonase/LRE family protein [Acidimicrobiales bacterium]